MIKREDQTPPGTPLVVIDRSEWHGQVGWFLHWRPSWRTVSVSFAPPGSGAALVVQFYPEDLRPLREGDRVVTP